MKDLAQILAVALPASPPAFRWSDFVGEAGGWELGSPSAVLEVFAHRGVIVVQVIATPYESEPEPRYCDVCESTGELPAILAAAFRVFSGGPLCVS